MGTSNTSSSSDINIFSNLTSVELLGQKGMDTAHLLYAARDQDLLMATEDITKQRSFLPTLLAYYTQQLARTNSALFKLLKDEQKKAIKDRLIYTYYLLYAQHQLDSAEGRLYAIPGLFEKMAKCASLIEQLENPVDPTTPKAMLDAELNASEKYFKFCGMTLIAPKVAQKMMAFIDEKKEEIRTNQTGIPIQIMSDVNALRLYGVWGTATLSCVLNLLPNDFFNKQQAQKGLAYPAPITGYMSWVLYYLRFGINLTLLLKHTINGPWMSEEEAKIPVWQRFRTQWKQRKFALLNDFIWATANLACFYWLKGPGTLGYMGNVFTVGLLLMDLTLTVWRFWEENTQHEKQMLHLKQAQQELYHTLQQAKNEFNVLQEVKPFLSEVDAPNIAIQIAAFQQKIAETEQKILDNQKLISKTKFDWKFQKFGHINNLVYAAGLVIAFSLMCCFFCPPAAIAPATLMILAMTGAALCFVLTVVYSAINSGLEIAKLYQSRKQIKQECTELLEQFNNTSDELTQKQLFLQIKGLMAESEENKRMINFQIIKFLRQVLVDAFLPAVVFTSLVFMPLGIGIGVLAAGFALAALSSVLIKQFAPKAKELPLECGMIKLASDPEKIDFAEISGLLSNQNGLIFYDEKLYYVNQKSKLMTLITEQEENKEKLSQLKTSFASLQDDVFNIAESEELELITSVTGQVHAQGFEEQFKKFKESDKRLDYFEEKPAQKTSSLFFSVNKKETNALPDEEGDQSGLLPI